MRMISSPSNWAKRLNGAASLRSSFTFKNRKKKKTWQTFCCKTKVKIYTAYMYIYIYVLVYNQINGSMIFASAILVSLLKSVTSRNFRWVANPQFFGPPGWPQNKTKNRDPSMAPDNNPPQRTISSRHPHLGPPSLDFRRSFWNRPIDWGQIRGFGYPFSHNHGSVENHL